MDHNEYEVVIENDEAVVIYDRMILLQHNEQKLKDKLLKDCIYLEIIQKSKILIKMFFILISN